jgi:hypothetical protein
MCVTLVPVTEDALLSALMTRMVSKKKQTSRVRRICANRLFRPNGWVANNQYSEPRSNFRFDYVSGHATTLHRDHT